MEIHVHAEEETVIEADFDRAYAGAAAGTGLLANGETLSGLPVVRVTRQVGGSYEDVTEDFVENPQLVGSPATRIQATKIAAIAGEQLASRIPYAGLFKCVTSGNRTLTIEFDLYVSNKARA